jgi:hypothetical protein
MGSETETGEEDENAKGDADRDIIERKELKL